MNRDEFLKLMAAGGMGIGMVNSISDPSHLTGFSNKAQSQNFKIEGFHIDLRVEVMKMPALKEFANELAQFGVNAIVMEYEATFPFNKHATIRSKYAYSREEITDFVEYCSSLGMEVIPLQECLGHAEYILQHDRYLGLRIEHTILSQIDPLDKKAIPLFTDLIEDLVSLHPSKYIHVGGDEARHLNHPKFSSYVEEHGISKLYTEYTKKICQIAIDLGKTPLLWADMILKHPEAVEDLPIDDIIFVDWNYGWDINRFGDIEALQKKGCEVWGAPALRSAPDNYYVTHWEKHFNNLRDFVPHSREAGYTGMVMTSWSTSGQYTFQWEGSRRAFLEKFPIRNVHPLSGFRILVVAYREALSIDEPIDPETFVINYAQQRFGLSANEGKALWNYFSYRQRLIHNGKAPGGKRVGDMRKDFQKVRESLHQLEPDNNPEEFEHFTLMADIRLFYLSVKEIEAFVESEKFDQSQIESVKQQLKPLITESERLKKKFIELNEGYLYDSELERLNNLRSHRLNSLWERFGES